MEKTLLIIVPESTTDRDAVFCLLVAETGECLASHLCSCAGFAYGDLFDRPDRRPDFEARFGEIEVKFIDETDVNEDELLARNKAWFDSLDKAEKTSA